MAGPKGRTGEDLFPAEGPRVRIRNALLALLMVALTATSTGYAVTAVPESFGNSGRRTFYSDQTLVVRNNWGPEPATPASPEIK